MQKKHCEQQLKVWVQQRNMFFVSFLLCQNEDMLHVVVFEVFLVVGESETCPLFTFHQFFPLSKWVFPKIVVPQNGWFIMENPIWNGWFGGTTIFGNTQIEPWVMNRVYTSVLPKPRVQQQLGVGSGGVWIWHLSNEKNTRLSTDYIVDSTQWYGDHIKKL